MSKYQELSAVESRFLHRSGRSHAVYDGEKIPVVEVQNVYELGKIVALSFLEWVSENPTGIIALPTGKTPEYFIKTLDLYKTQWTNPQIRAEITSLGFTLDSFPETKNLTFVMLDEFFPMLPTHRNSFCNYVRNFYLKTLGIADDKVLDFDLLKNGVLTEEELSFFDKINVDLSLLSRDAVNEEESLAKAILLKAKSFCDTFEQRLQELGGIGFFLGGIGPDGHIAFNQEGADHDCTTRLVSFNYPTAAAAASDLGGIEKARGKAAMTIGLKTITFNPQAKIIIMAAGEGKATVVRAAIEEVAAPARPASVLQGMRNARFYLTHGAAMKLTQRKQEQVHNITSQVTSWALAYLSGQQTLNTTAPYLVKPSDEYLLLESVLYDASLALKIPVHGLNLDVLRDSKAGLVSLPNWLSQDPLAFNILCACASRRLKDKIEGGLIESQPKGLRVLHTAPHHDDIMLSYHAAMHEMLGRQPVLSVNRVSLVADTRLQRQQQVQTSAVATLHEHPSTTTSTRGRSGSFTSYTDNILGEKHNGNLNHFAYLTSGFHSVNDDFLWQQANAALGQWQVADASCNSATTTGTVSFIAGAVKGGQLTREYDDLMSQFRLAFFQKDVYTQDLVEHLIFLRKVAEVWQITLAQSYAGLVAELTEKVTWIRDDYLAHHVPGDAVPKDMQLLKGCMRESEVDRVWALSAMPMNRVHHLRSKFYTDDFFTPMPSLEDDALPVANLIRARQPDVLTVAFDPEGTGPDTHYKVLTVVAAGLRMSLDRDDLENRHVLIWGYRNVWFVFPPAQATLFIPCSTQDLDLMHDTFMACFTTQKKASFPSPHYDGPFSAWARQIQRDQRQMLGTLLGEDYFAQHPHPRVRHSDGFIFLQAMDVQAFLAEVEDLKSKFENV